MSRQLILTHGQIEKKITRLSLQVYEQFFSSGEIIICGLNERGFHLANLLTSQIESNRWLKVHKMNLHMAGIESFAKDADVSAYKKDTPVIIADDVLNTGYTMMQAVDLFFNKGFHNINILVLADRNHRKFPIHARLVGISLSTTLQEHLSFEINEQQMELYLS